MSADHHSRAPPRPAPADVVRRPTERVRCPLPHLRSGRPLPVRRRPGLHPARLGHRRLRSTAGTARSVACRVRPGELPRHGQLGDGRRDRTRRRPVRGRGDDRRIVLRCRHRSAPRRRCPRHTFQLRRPSRRRTRARRVLADRRPGRAVRVAHRAALRRQGPAVVRRPARPHAVPVRHRPHGAGPDERRARSGAVPGAARRDGRRAGAG